MTALKHGYGVPLAVVIIAAGAFLATRSHSEASTTVEALARATHFHGIAVDPPIRRASISPRTMASMPSSRTASRRSCRRSRISWALRRIPPTRRSSTRAAIRRAAAISASSLPKMAAGPGASSPRARAAQSTSIRWTSARSTRRRSTEPTVAIFRSAGTEAKSGRWLAPRLKV